MRKSLLMALAGGALAAALMATPQAVAQGGPPSGGGGGTDSATYSLAMPTVFIGDMGTSFPTITSCPGGPIAPTGTQDSDSYYIQGQATWQAECATATAASDVTPKWGDNLSSPQPRAGFPIQVGVAMTMPVAAPMVGYTVENLTPALAARDSTYGTKGDQVPFTTVGVWDAGATLSIFDVTTDTTVYSGPATSEVNSVGQVVYSYGWGTSESGSGKVVAGDYTLTFTAPNVTFTTGGDAVSLNLTVPENTHGNGGGGGETEAANNLSVPTIFIGDMTPFTGITSCPSGPTGPTGLPNSDGYYPQGESIWQAECDTATSASDVTAEWGDNLSSPQPKAGTPIRVEVAMTMPVAPPMVGYTVENLTPDLADRNADYGTNGVPVESSTAGVWDAAATISIVNDDTGATLYSGPGSSEINSFGQVVYGFNWGTGKSGSPAVVAGNYTLTFTAPNITLAGGGDSITLNLNVPEDHGGQGGGGGGQPETGITNLSVPTIFVADASSFTGVTCPGGPTDPVGTATDGYYIQGQTTWQAQCATAPSESNVTAHWGDNLSTSQPKAGSPIRVEVSLTKPVSTPMVGYTVVNLTPDLADRNSTYGTTGTQVAFSTVGVWAAGATLSIVDKGTGAVVYSGPAAAEINSTGQVVYGYDWGTGNNPEVVAGDYTLTFTAPNINVASGGLSLSMNLTVPESGSGQGGGGGQGGGSGQGGPTITTQTTPSGNVVIGTSVYVTATLSGSAGDSLGSIAYTVYSDAACSAFVADITPIANQVVDGVVPSSKSIDLTTAGTYYFQAIFTGDLNYGSPVSSACTSAAITVSAPAGGALGASTTSPSTSSPGTGAGIGLGAAILLLGAVFVGVGAAVRRRSSRAAN